MPDNLGLFGMVDDLEVLRFSINQLEPLNISEKILDEVSGVDTSLHSLLVERTSSHFLNTLPLFAMSKPMKLLVGATRFLMVRRKQNSPRFARQGVGYFATFVLVSVGLCFLKNRHRLD